MKLCAIGLVFPEPNTYVKSTIHFLQCIVCVRMSHFLYHTYTTTEGWCDFRVVNKYCHPFIYGYITHFAIWYGPVYLTHCETLFLSNCYCCYSSQQENQDIIQDN